MENLLSLGTGRPLTSPRELQEAIACLSRASFFKEAPLDMMFSILTEAAAEKSGIERVSIWALNNDEKELLSLDLFELTAQRHSKGEILLASRYPTYFQALRSGNSVAADNAQTHPLTAEFAADYLPRRGVTAMLCTPIHIRGELQGVLTLEQVGSRQPWTSAHGLFAQALANLVTLALVEYEAEEARSQAQAADRRLKEVFRTARETLAIDQHVLAS